MNSARTTLSLIIALSFILLSLCGCAGIVTGGSDGKQIAPSINAQPAPKVVKPGQTATFSVAATGTAPLSYQWQRNGSAVSGANNSSYTTPPTKAADNGAKFHVVITNSVGTAVSDPTTLTVSASAVSLQSIEVSPANASINQSQNQQFTATGKYSDGSSEDITTSVTWTSSSPTVVSVGANTGLATGLAAGTSQITATLSGVSSPSATLTVIKSVSIQSISVSPSTASINQAQTQQFTATGTYSDGSSKNITTSVTWTSSSSGVASVGVNSGLATGIAAGTAQIAAALGSVSSPGATLTVVKSVSLESISVTPGNVTINQSQTQQFTATGKYSDGSSKNITTSVSWVSSSSGVASVGLNSGLATGISAGVAQITATLGSISSPGAALTVVKSVSIQSISVSPSNATISQTQSQQFVATGTYSDGSSKDITTSVVWSSSNTGVASVGVNSGLATGVAAGTSQISAALSGVTSPGAALTVTKSISLQSISISPTGQSINQSQTVQFTATGKYSDGSSKNITTSVTWASSSAGVASVGVNSGLATGISAGTSQITATLGSVVSTIVTLTVIKSISLQSISLSPANVSINQSQTQQFSATGTYSDGSSKNITSSVTWTSSNTSVASIGVNSGLATSISGGTSQITATLGSVSSPSATLTVIKSITLQSITVLPANASISQSQTQQFSATGTYSDGSTKNVTSSVTWTSSNSSVASIGVNSGLANGIAAGTSQVVATLGSVSSPSATLTVIKSVTLQSIAVLPANASISQSQTQQFTATGTYSDGSSKDITTSAVWNSSNTAVATVGANTGVATGEGAGTTQISASFSGVVSSSPTLTVIKSITLQSIALSPASTSISQSQTQQFTATGTYSDGSSKNITTTVTWSSSNTSVATVGPSPGQATAINAGTAQITAALSGITSPSATLTVTKSVSLQSVSVSPSNPSINQGQTQPFTATGTYSDGSSKDVTTSATWASSNTAVSTVSASTGVATGVSAGSSQITAALSGVVSSAQALTVKAITLQSIAISPSNPAINPAQTQQFTATGTYSDGSSKDVTTSATWASSNSAVATIGASSGLATGVAAGSSQITASIGSVVSSSHTLTVNAITLDSISVAPGNPSINQSQTQQFSATGSYSDGSNKDITGSVQWFSSDSAVATIGASSGLATGVSEGSAQISATQGSITSTKSTLTVTGTSNHYTTNFALTESSLSEGGKWINGGTTGLDWGNVQSTPGLAFGSVLSGAPPFNDSTAVLTGSWASNQMAQGTVHTVNQSSAIQEEVELRLRTTITPHSITGYEFDYRVTADGSQYIVIVRWNGPQNSFCYLYSGGCTSDPNAATIPGPGLHNGDIVKATAVGSTLSLYINGVKYLQVTDSTFTDGSPGIGFWNHGGTLSNNSDFGFSSFTASDL